MDQGHGVVSGQRAKWREAKGRRPLQSDTVSIHRGMGRTPWAGMAMSPGGGPPSPCWLLMRWQRCNGCRRDAGIASRLQHVRNGLACR